MTYEKNIDALKTRHSEIYDSIMNKRVVWNRENTETRTAKNGQTIVGYVENDKTIFFNSRYNPENEAERFISEYVSMPDESVLVIFGFADGSFMRSFFKGNKNDVKCLVYEPVPDIFMRVLEEEDISDVLLNENFYLAVNGINLDSFNILLYRLLWAENLKTNMYISLPVYQNVFPEQYEQYKKVIYTKVHDFQILVNTFSIYGPLTCRRGISNIRYLPGCRSGMEYIGLFPEDLPAIIVSAGPSLEKNIDLLKEVKGKALVIAVDKALPALLNRNIIPDIVVTVDIEASPDDFDGENVSDIVLFGDMSMNTEILDKVKPRNLVFYSSESLLWDDLLKKANSEIQIVWSGGSVSLDAISNAIIFGLRKIILIGQDLAFKDDKLYADGDVADLSEYNLTYVKDIHGNDILTKKDFASFIRSIEELAYSHPNIEIIDATEGGAYKKNTTIMTLREAIDKYCIKEYDLYTMLRKPKKLFLGDDWKYVPEALENLKKDLESLKEILEKSVSFAEEGAFLLQNKDYNVSRLREINDTLAKADDMFCSSYARTHILKCISAADYQFSLDIQLTEENHIDEAVRMYKNSGAYYKAMVEAIPFIIEMVDDCLKKILDDKVG